MLRGFDYDDLYARTNTIGWHFWGCCNFECFQGQNQSDYDDLSVDLDGDIE